ncbi:Elongin-C [Nosema granulosis]|uniref:Elongin-C n=1 Tax=Nosema granulosis TaxID=83296 RepID=A0A9P6L033_9MICR|nr:Elongin-C [Nosema granulosis]
MMEDENNIVTLVSSDGIQYKVYKHLAIQSKTLNTFLNSNPCFIEHRTQHVMLPIKGVYLKRIIEYLEYKYFAKNTKSFDEFEIGDDETVDLLDAAAYLRL